MSLNKAILTGKIISDIDTRFTADGSEVSHCVLLTSSAVQIRCNCWGNLSTALASLKKNDEIMCTGSLITVTQKSEHSTATNKIFQLNVREIYSMKAGLEKLVLDATTPSKPPKNNPPSTSNTTAISNEIFDESEEDEEIPF